MKKMDEYFKKQLQDYSASEDGWNMPSEELWERAKKEFPKPKKDRKVFYFFLLAGLLVGMSVLLLWMSKSEKNYTDNIIHDEQPIIKKELNGEVVEIENKKDSSLVINSNNKKVVDLNNQINKDLKNLTSKSEAQKISNENQILNFDKDQISNSLTKDKTNLTISKFDRFRDKELSKENILTADATPPMINTSMEIESNKKPINLNQLTTVSKDEIKIESRKEETLNYITAGQIFGVKMTNDLPIKQIEFPFSSTLVQKEKRKWELGASISTYSVGPPYTLSAINPDNDIDFINIDSDFYGLNFWISKPMGKRFSLSSGLRFSTQRLLLNVGVDKEWGSITGSNVEFSSDNFLPQQIELMINDMVNLEPDDILAIRGKASLRMYSAAIPLQLNYHFKKTKWEYLLSIGGFIGFDGFLDSFLDIEFENENQLLGSTKESIEGGIVPQASIYAGFGVKYHMNKKWNLGSSVLLDSRVGLPGNYLRLEMGLFMSL